MLPQYFRWTGQRFEPAGRPEVAELVVADSWRVHRGRTWGLDDHLERFLSGIQAQAAILTELPETDWTQFATQLRHRLIDVAAQYAQSDLFPRVSVINAPHGLELGLLIRPAPSARQTTRLWIPQYTDPRTRPTVKGPDIDLMRRLVSEAPADDVVLHDGTNVHETTTGGLLIWQTPDHLVCCHTDQQLASISVRRIANYANAHSITVSHRPVTIEQIVTGEYPVWFANTLHGISPVTTIKHGTKEISVAAHPHTDRWQAAWWAQFRSGEPKG